MIALKIVLLLILATDQFFFWRGYAKKAKVYVQDDSVRLLLRASIWVNAVLVTFVCYLTLSL
jgi:hypothetical protein